ncbi:sensor histidine kinase [Pacificoceanicola onchidii]|uniref:sensor histidine kinase n=1 Tax=Pacificoceanicola onchidii TaxID=2562685 RepID=UPI0010A55F02|nr:ATP-binding protein [Pacificoceanicola onchidii]
MRLAYTFTLFLVLAVSLALFQGAFLYFTAQQSEQAAARLTVYQNTLESEIRHFAHLPFLLSLDPMVTETLKGADTGALDKRLARFSQSAGVDAIYLMDHTGHTLSASNARSAASFKGQNYGYRPYFKAAQNGELGEFYGIGATTGEPGYFYAIAVRHPDGGPDGVIAIKVDLSPIQDVWQASGERVLLANADGVVLLASDPAWRYRTLTALSAGQKQRIDLSRQFAGEALDPLDWSTNDDAQTADIGGDTLLHLSAGGLPNSWSLHFLEPRDTAITRAGLTTGGFVMLAMMSFILFQTNRARRVSLALRKSEREEALLRQANAKLAIEIEERRLAERTLQKTQAELEQAGRLAALGQLASSVTHELGQPIAAMRNQLTAAEMTQGATPLNDKMQGLVARMENITKQLKFFSRKGRDKFEPLDLREVVAAARDLNAPNIAHIGAQLTIAEPGAPLILKGNRMRLEQVVTNILRNALDAVEMQAEKRIDIAMGAGDGQVWLEVSDSGHGLGDQSFDELREPFATTRESGRGMGLGLTISAGIVSDHGGTITAQNRASGGAVFHIALPQDKEAAPT